jgi:uncharacterized protein
MAVTVNLRHLEANDVHLSGELPLGELDIDPHDELLHLEKPLEYDLQVQKMEEGLLVQGRLRLELKCECARCLKPFVYPVELKDWSLHLPFQGEEAVLVVNDCVDLTPYLREDILLEFPQHPLCDPECRGLPKTLIGKAKKASNTNQTDADASAWAELNKLKF